MGGFDTGGNESDDVSPFPDSRQLSQTDRAPRDTPIIAPRARPFFVCSDMQ